MSCEDVQERTSLLLDRKVSAAEREKLVRHLRACPACGAHLQTMEGMRTALRTMNAPRVPARLGESLRVIASQERIRQLTRRSLSARLQMWVDRIHLEFENMMRPMALPFAGGVLSALLLFSILVPSLSFHHHYGYEPPMTEPDGIVVGAIGDFPRIEPVNSANEGDGPVVELTVDENGHVQDYSVLRGELTPDGVSIILFSQFTPATNFGQPTWGKVKVCLRPRHARS